MTDQKNLQMETTTTTTTTNDDLKKAAGSKTVPKIHSSQIKSTNCLPLPCASAPLWCPLSFHTQRSASFAGNSEFRNREGSHGSVMCRVKCQHGHANQPYHVKIQCIES